LRRRRSRRLTCSARGLALLRRRFDAKTGKLQHHSSFIGGAIAPRGWTAYVGGSIRNNIGLHNLLAVDVHTGDNLKWFPNIAREVAVAKIARSGDKAFVGGLFCRSL
jgi:hypothetical protein